MIIIIVVVAIIIIIILCCGIFIGGVKWKFYSS